LTPLKKNLFSDESKFESEEEKATNVSFDFLTRSSQLKKEIATLLEKHSSKVKEMIHS
jgi:hypothetical protein